MSERPLPPEFYGDHEQPPYIVRTLGIRAEPSSPADAALRGLAIDRLAGADTASDMTKQDRQHWIPIVGETLHVVIGGEDVAAAAMSVNLPDGVRVYVPNLWGPTDPAEGDTTPTERLLEAIEADASRAKRSKISLVVWGTGREFFQQHGYVASGPVDMTKVLGG